MRLSPRAFDRAYQIAVAHGLSVNALMRNVLERVFTHQKSERYCRPCYVSDQQASTLHGVVAGRVSSPVDVNASSSMVSGSSSR